MDLKHIAYLGYFHLLRAYWKVRGARVIAAMGQTYRFSPETEFPTHRRLRLPKGDCRSEIVRYTDFVQMHACCQYCLTLLQPVIVDVGAHHGAYAVVLGKIAQNRGGKLIAIEPNPTNFAILRQNIMMNGLEETVALEQVAITEKRSKIGLRSCGSQSYVTQRGLPGSVDVKGEPLAEVIDRHQISAVDLLIIDVEGAELPVLSSFPWSRVEVGRIFCELHPNEWANFGYTPGDFREFLQKRGFLCLDMYYQEHELVPTSGYIGPCCLLGSKDR